MLTPFGVDYDRPASCRPLPVRRQVNDTPDFIKLDVTARPAAIGLICNPHSGRNRRQLARIESMIADCPAIQYIPTATVDDIQEALESYMATGIDALAINGGDGTVAQVLTQLLRISPSGPLPPLILLPGGTTNMNVGDVGIRTSLIQAVQQLIEWTLGERATGQIVSRPALEVRLGNGAPPLYGMLFGAGAVVQAIEYWNSRVKRSGFRDEFSSGLAMLRTVWGLVRGDPRFSKPVPATIRLDSGKVFEIDIMLMAVSSMRRVFLNFSPFWGQEPKPLHFTLIRSGADRFLCAVLPVFRGRPNRLVTPATGYHSHNIAHLNIEMTGSFTLDGDIYHVNTGDNPVQIRHYCDIPFIRF